MEGKASGFGGYGPSGSSALNVRVWGIQVSDYSGWGLFGFRYWASMVWVDFGVQTSSHMNIPAMMYSRL